MQTPPIVHPDGVDPEPRAEQGMAGGTFALTERQKLFWVERKLAPGIPLHNNALILDLEGELDVPRLEAAYRRMVADLDCMRLFVDDSAPSQWVVDAEAPPVEHVDLSDAPETLDTWMGERSTHVFEFPGWLFRPSILRLGRDRHVFFLLLHHIGTDGVSAMRLVDYLADLYEGKKPSPGPSFREYAVFEAAYKTSPKYRSDAEYWSAKIGKGVPPLRFYGLPRNGRSVAVEQIWCDGGAERRARFDEMLSHGSYRLVSPAMSRLAGLATLLFAFMHRVTENRELVIATPVHNRAVRFKNTFGLMMEQTFLKVEIDEGETFASLYQKVRRDVLKSFGHAQYCATERGLDFVSLNLFTHRTGKFASLDCHVRLQSALTLGGSHGIAGAPKGVIGVQIHDAEDAASFVVGFELHAATFPPARRSRLTEHFVRLLDAFLDDPSRGITGVDLLGDAERAELLRCARGPEPATPPFSLVERLEEHCSRRPEKVAVIGPDEQLTYGGLCSKVNRLARRLMELGVRPGRCVAVSLPRGAAELTTLLAVLTAGGAYVPLDPAQPRERLLMIVEDAAPELLVTWRGASLADARAGWHAVFLEEELPGLNRFDDKPLHAAVSGDDLAYVLFTSGSTGRPKGVEITRRSLDNFLASMEREPGLSDRDRLLAITTTMFDIAGLELFLPLCVGATVQIADRETAVDSRRLRATLERDPITVLQATPATWRSLVEMGWSGDKRLRMLCGGEALNRELANQLLDRGGALWNLYGPTETTVWSTIARVERGGEIAIGHPIDRTQVYVVDEGGHLAPFGVTGELCIGGTGVARGYRGRPELTQDRFVPDRWGGGADRVYRTGDLARLHDSGTFECLGRVDHQVKIRGYRIELGEIESVLRKVPGVVDAVVVARPSSAGDPRLVGYFMGTAETPALHDRLRTALPQYMHPSAIVRLESFPLNANGKVDRKALPEPPDVQSPEQHRVLPQTPVEIRLCAIWEKAVGRRGIGVTDSFFDMGGDSLLAVKVLEEIHKAFGVDLELTVLFEAPTVEALAQRIASSVAPGSAEPSSQQRSIVMIQKGANLLPFFCVHGARGHVLVFRDLSKAMPPEQPFYGLQAHGVDGTTKPQEVIEEMAETYLAEVRDLQPHGPYLLGGYSGGGVVAFEMARRLTEAGEQVALLALIDTPNPLMQLRVPTTMARIVGDGFRVRFRRAMTGGLPYLIAALRRKRDEARELARAAREEREADALRAQGRVLPLSLRSEDMERSFERAFVRYRPQRWSGKAVLFRAKDVDFLFAEGGPCYGWDEIIEGGVEVLQVPGNHQSMLRGPSAEVLFQSLGRVIEEVQSSFATTRRAS
jgi:amino acid adenylation domain-containing protein